MSVPIQLPSLVTRIDENVRYEGGLCDTLSSDYDDPVMMHTFWLDKSTMVDQEQEQDHPSWIQVFKLPHRLMPTDEERSELWNHHPEERGQVRTFGKVHTVKRWFQSYGKPYYFSGMPHLADETPPLIQKYIDWIQSLPYSRPDDNQIATGDHRGIYNQTLVNWYSNGHDKIDPHADDESTMHSGTPIICITFSGCRECTEDSVDAVSRTGGTRTFRIRRGAPTGQPRPIALDLQLEDGIIYVMGGYMQERVPSGRGNGTYPRFTHESPAIGGKKGAATGSRVSLTFRQFKD